MHTVGSGGVVLADGHHPSFVGETVSRWSAQTGFDLSTAASGGYSSSGYTWMGPFPSARLSPDGVQRPYYLLYVPLLIEDRLSSAHRHSSLLVHLAYQQLPTLLTYSACVRRDADDVGNGIGETLVLLVAVSAYNPQSRRASSAGCNLMCKSHSEYTSALAASCDHFTAGSRVCDGLNWTDVESVGDGCTARFYDSADANGDFSSNSQHGLMAWNDAAESVPMCGCATGHELVLVTEDSLGARAANLPSSAWTYGAGATGVCTACEGTAESCAAVIDMHTRYASACAQSFAPTADADLTWVWILVAVIIVFAGLIFATQRRRQTVMVKKERKVSAAAKAEVRGR